MVGYLIVITILTVFSLTLIIINSRIRKDFKSIEDSQHSFINQIDLRFEQQEEKKEEEIADLKRNQTRRTLQTKNAKAELFLKSIIRNLDKEDIGVIVTDISENEYSNVSYNGTRSKEVIHHGKQIIFSYDSKKEMHDLLLFEEKQFKKKYKSRISYTVLLRYIRMHYNDKELLGDVITERIKKMLAEDLMGELINDKEEKNSLEELRKKAKKVLSSSGINIHAASTKNPIPRSEVNDMFKDLFKSN